MNIQLDADERLEPLGKNVKIVVSDCHPFGTDALLLADFSSIRRGEKVCDLGTGCGIIPFMWHKSGLTDEIYAVDIQKKACAQVRKSIEFNENVNIKICEADLRELRGVLPFGYFDLVTMNPPYKPIGTGVESVSESDKIARHETMCTLDDLVFSAKKLLRFGGRLCICHKPERLCDIVISMRNGGIEPKRIRFVSQVCGARPWLVLVEGRSGGKPYLTVEKELYINDPDGTYSEDMKRIFADYNG